MATEEILSVTSKASFAVKLYELIIDVKVSDASAIVVSPKAAATAEASTILLTSAVLKPC